MSTALFVTSTSGVRVENRKSNASCKAKRLRFDNVNSRERKERLKRHKLARVRKLAHRTAAKE